GRRVVHTAARAMGELDRAAARRWLEETGPRNADISIGGVRIKPNTALIAALARVGGRLGYQVGIEALRAKLAAMGVNAPFIHSIERELNREGISLGQLAAPAPMVGTFGALTPQALAGRWLAQKI